jgi:hypothetical protein
VVYRDYDTSENPPILHRKETFVTPDYPLYEKFAKLTHQEENWGLLDDTSTIGNPQRLAKMLERTLRGTTGSSRLLAQRR